MATTDLREDLRNIWGQLETMRDEIRVRLHLAGMEAKELWDKDLEPQINHAEQLASEATEASKEALNDLATKLRAFKDSHFKDDSKNEPGA